jgi:hypothetical protein
MCVSNTFQHFQLALTGATTKLLGKGRSSRLMPTFLTIPEESMNLRSTFSVNETRLRRALGIQAG